MYFPSALSQIIGHLLGVATIVYFSLALWQVWRFRERRHGVGDFRPPVTIMAPVYGAPPGLYECLRSFCRQRYPQFQIVFGLHSADDAGRAVIERLIAEFPTLDTALVIDGRRAGTNPKMCNLANMIRAVKHDVILMLDSDVEVDPNFLSVVVEPLRDPAVGGVTCAYHALPQPGLSSALGAMHINDWFLPSAFVDLSRREMDICYGAAIGVTRQSLAAIGGLEALASAVAQDDVFGQRLVEAGYKVVLAPRVVATVVAEPSLPSLVKHELRWMRTVRACRPRDHALAVVMFALPPTLLLCGPGARLSGLVLASLVWTLRYALHFTVRARFRVPRTHAAWLVPVRECLGFGIWLVSFTSRTMHWGEHVLIGGEGRSMRMRDPNSP